MFDQCEQNEHSSSRQAAVAKKFCCCVLLIAQIISHIQGSEKRRG